VKRTYRIVLLVLLLATLPLRGYAGVLMSLCESHHGGTPATEQHDHEHGDSHDHGANDGSGGTSHAASVCSVCASCCAGAGVASEAIHGLAFPTLDTNRIPFLVRQVSGFVPEHLDRPPLAS